MSKHQIVVNFSESHETHYTVDNNDCNNDCNVIHHCALEVLQGNTVELFTFAAAMRKLLTKGRGKFSYILIVRPVNCGNTFL